MSAECSIHLVPSPGCKVHLLRCSLRMSVSHGAALVTYCSTNVVRVVGLRLQDQLT